MPEKSNSRLNKEFEIIDLTPENIAHYGVCGYKDVTKHLELQRKIRWFEEYYPKGLKIKIIVTESGGYQGMLEYIPGTYAHRPVNAGNYMFIHCIFLGFRKEFKNRGFASHLIDACIQDTLSSGLKGVAVVTRKGSFMVDKTIFLKKGFVAVDKMEPDFELLALKFDPLTENPSFKHVSAQQYNEGLTIIRSPQCPYSVKNVEAILKSSEKMGINANIIEAGDSISAQNSPCAFGTFCIIFNGKIISHHPISNTRFENIMNAMKK